LTEIENAGSAFQFLEHYKLKIQALSSYSFISEKTKIENVMTELIQYSILVEY